MKGLEKLRDRGAISDECYEYLKEELVKSTSIVPVVEALNGIAYELCDHLDREDIREGEMDNVEYPDVEERITEGLKNMKDEEAKT